MDEGIYLLDCIYLCFIHSSYCYTTTNPMFVCSPATASMIVLVRKRTRKGPVLVNFTAREKNEHKTALPRLAILKMNFPWPKFQTRFNQTKSSKFGLNCKYLTTRYTIKLKLEHYFQGKLGNLHI